MKSFIKNSLFVLCSNIVSKIISFITLGVLSRLLNTESFGNFSAIQNSANSGTMIGSLGIPVVLQLNTANISEYNKKDLNAIISNCIILFFLSNVSICLLLLLFPGLFIKILLNSSLDYFYNFHLVILIFLTALNTIPLYVLTGLGEFKNYALRNISFNVITFIITILILFYYRKTITAALVALYISNLVTLVITLLIFKKVITKYSLSINLIPNMLYVNKILSSGFVYYLGNSLLVAVSGLVTISVFYKYLTPDQYGLLRISSALSIILSIIPAAFQPVNLSKIFLTGDQNKLKSFQIRIIPFTTISFYLLLSPNLSNLISILFGNNYSGGIEFIFNMVLLQIPAIYLGIFSNFLTAKGALNFIGFVAVVGTVTLIISLFLLTPLFKLDAYIYSSFITTCISLILVLIKEMKVQTYLFKREFVSFLINIFIIVLNLYCVHYFQIYGVLVSLILITIYVSTSYLFCFSLDEKVKIKHQICLLLSPFLKK